MTLRPEPRQALRPSLATAITATFAHTPSSNKTTTNTMSRFVSAGTQEDPPERDDAWLAAQQELDASRMRKEEAARQDTGKSLYETLQANKGISSPATRRPHTQTCANTTSSQPWPAANMPGFLPHHSRQTRSF